MRTRSSTRIVTSRGVTHGPESAAFRTLFATSPTDPGRARSTSIGLRTTDNCQATNAAKDITTPAHAVMQRMIRRDFIEHSILRRGRDVSRPKVAGFFRPTGFRLVAQTSCWIRRDRATRRLNELEQVVRAARHAASKPARGWRPMDAPMKLAHPRVRPPSSGTSWHRRRSSTGSTLRRHSAADRRR